jgi:MFS-type transporter involved in bile tolerance (Atg22 family)
MPTRRGAVARASGWAANHLAVLFGATTAVWLFIVAPLVVLLFPAHVQAVVFYLASGWIQLWALPLLTYVANQADVARVAKAEADHQALTSVHTTVDTVAAINATQDSRLARIETRLGIPPPDPATSPDERG